MAFGDVVRSAEAPDTNVAGIGGDANTIWHTDNGTHDVYELSITDLSEIRHANSPNAGGDSGIGGDANTIWHCNFNTDLVYELSTTDLSTVRSAGCPASVPKGVGGDANTIWHCDSGTDDVYELSTTDLSTVRSEDAPALSASGIGGDANAIWHCDSGLDTNYELSTTDFSVVRSVACPRNGPFGIGGDVNTIWHCDFTSPDLISELDAVPANQPPTAPTALLCEGESAPQNVIDMTPDFSAVFNDPNEGDIANAVEIHVATTEGGLGAPDLWDSGWLAIGVNQGNRSADIEYAGSDLAINQTYYWKIRFRDDDDAEGEWSSIASFATSWFENWQERQTLTPQRRFVYDGIIETERVKSFGSLSRESDVVVSGGTSITLINADKYWNKFLTDKSNLRREAKLQLGIGAMNTIARSGIARSGITASNLIFLAPGSTTSSGIWLAGQGHWFDVFTGWGDDPEFVGIFVHLPLRDKFAGLAEKELGSEESPLDYFSCAYNPADLAWEILVTHSGLDSTPSIANVDIDYASWSNWKAACAATALSLKARFTGQAVNVALELIKNLTNSNICAAGNGKISFNRFTSSSPPGDVYHFDEDRFQEPSAKLDSSKIINSVRVFYGYDPSTGNWVGSHLEEDTDSQQTPPSGYGLSSETVEGKIVWHSTLSSAVAYAGRRIARFSTPIESILFRSFAMGLATEVGDIVRFSDAFLGYSEDYLRVFKISDLNLDEATINFEARKAETVEDLLVREIEWFEYSSNALAQAAFVPSSAPPSGLRVWSRLESNDDVVNPQTGIGGSVDGSPTWNPVKFGKGMFPPEGTGAIFPTVANDINVDKGTIEFWSKLNWNRTTYKKNCYFFSFRKYSPIFGSNYIRKSGPEVYQHSVFSVAANNIFYISFDEVYPGTLSSINIFIKCRGSTSKIKCALYKGFVANNGALVANGTTDEETVPGNWDDWVTFSFSTPPTVVAGQPYLIAVWSNQSIYLYRIAWTGSIQQYFGTRATAYDGFPDPLVKDEYVTGYAWPIYAQYDFTIGDRGIWFAWLWIGKILHVRVYGATLGTAAQVIDWPFTNGSVHHFGITWDRAGADIGGGKTLMIKVDDVEVASSLVTWDTTPDISPVLNVAAGRSSRQSLVGGLDNLKTYNICKTDFSDRMIEDPYGLRCYSESVVKVQGSYSLRIFARATDSLNGTLTRTVSPVIDLSDFIEIRFAVQASRIGSNFKVSIRDSGGLVTDHVVNIIAVNVWQTEKWSILGVDNTDKDAIDRLIITITNADTDNVIYFDKMYAVG